MTVQIVATGFAAEQYRDELERLLFLKERLGLLMRCYGAYMVKAEQWFHRWTLTGGRDHERAYANYLKYSSLAARMHARHSHLSTRILGGVR